jgi:uncharacterized protein (DUF4415 family)
MIREWARTRLPTQPESGRALEVGAFRKEKNTMGDRPRRTGSTRDTAEAAFKAATTKRPAEAGPPKSPAIPGARETVSLRIDREVLDHFQADGPGWQDRINAALRKAAGK